MIKPQTLKGFRDFLPKEARKRQYVMAILKDVFEKFDYQPIETPVLEYEEVLTGKYGDEGENLMYRFEDKGKRRVAMRYDQTVPLARVVAQYGEQLPMPFMRYQIQNVWRAENTQKGRFREFIQCDADIVGSFNPTADAQVIVAAAAGLCQLGFRDFTVLINDREIFEGLSTETLIVIDKLKKIKPEGVHQELIEKKIVKDLSEAQTLLESITKKQPTKRLTEIFEFLNQIKEGFKELEGVKFKFTPTLARGLNYYTSTIFEIEIPGYDAGSVCGGGRYDNLIGIFAGKQIPAVGFAYGFDRIISAMEDLDLFPPKVTESFVKVLVTIASENSSARSIHLVTILRNNDIKAEIYLGDHGSKIEKQLKYADRKDIPYVVTGIAESNPDNVLLKNMKTREQKEVTVEELIEMLKA